MSKYHQGYKKLINYLEEEEILQDFDNYFDNYYNYHYNYFDNYYNYNYNCYNYNYYNYYNYNYNCYYYYIKPDIDIMKKFHILSKQYKLGYLSSQFYYNTLAGIAYEDY